MSTPPEDRSARAEEVLLDERDGVLLITLNRPAARNAADRAMAVAVADALDELDRREDLRVGVITGAGGTFCAGMDLKAFLGGQLPLIEGRGFLGLVEAPPAKPLIAAVEGHALAGGLEVVLACDLVIAAEDALLGLPEVKRGLVAGAGGLVSLPRLVPPNLAHELVLTGDPVGAPRAAQMGLVNRIVPPGTAMEEAMTLAASIAANGPMAVRVSKQVMRASQDWPREERFERQRALIRPVFDSEDAHEGARAFAERRRPHWQGR